jgi:hypothetical protein
MDIPRTRAGLEERQVVASELVVHVLHLLELLLKLAPACKTKTTFRTPRLISTQPHFGSSVQAIAHSLRKLLPQSFPWASVSTASH